MVHRKRLQTAKNARKLNEKREKNNDKEQIKSVGELWNFIEIV